MANLAVHNGSARAASSLETQTMRRVFWRTMPFFFICYIVAYLDRVNVSFAGLEMNRQLGFSPEQFGIGVGIFTFGYVLFEVPSNIVLAKVGARFWIARIMITWGILSVGMAFIHGLISFYAMRMLLGATEAGFIPGILLFISYWFPAGYRGRVTSMLFFAIPVSAVFGSIMSGFLLQMHGIGGLSGWQWLFLIEGLPAILLGIVCLALISSHPSEAKWLKPEERQWLIEAVGKDGDRDVVKRGFGEHIRVALNGRVAALTTANMCLLIGFWGLAAWLPQMVNEVVADTRLVGIIAAVPYFAGGIAMLFWARHSDRRNERTYHASAAALLAAIGFCVCSFAPNPMVGYVGVILAAIGILCFLVLLYTLMSLMLDPQERIVGIAIVVSVGNLGSFFGPYLMGWLRGSTGSFQSGLIYLSGVMIIGAVLTLACFRSAGRRAALQTHEEVA